MNRRNPLRPQTRARVADTLLWLAITAPVFLDDSLPNDDQPAGLPIRWLQLAAVPLLAAAVAVSRRRPALAAAVPVALGLAATPSLYTVNFTVAQMALAFLVGRRTAGMRPGLLLCAGACVAGLPLAAVASDRDRWSWFDLVLTVLLTLLLPWLAGRFVRQRHELLSSGWELAERLEREHDLVGERTRLRERSRIASDMHDSLGHELSLLAVRAAALQVRPGLDDEARQAAADLRESAAAATERLREIVGVLGADGRAAPDQPADDTIGALVARAEASGLPVTLTGELPPLPPMADRAAYRVVQEALTNAAKHAPGADVTVRLGADGDDAVVGVTSGPAAAEDPSASRTSGGYGLVGLDERVRLSGGRLHAGPSEDAGFTVTARLPLTAGAAATPPDAQGQFAQARRRVRRSVLDAIWLPLAAVLGLAALLFAYAFWFAYGSRLEADAYRGLRVGQSAQSAEMRLPDHVAYEKTPEGAPAEPQGTDDCRYYRATATPFDPTSLYRLCFTDGRLSHKDKVELRRR